MRTNTYSNFGELQSVAWSDTTVTPVRNVSINYTYDALSRIKTSSETYGGTLVPNTSHSWSYDTDTGSPHLQSKYALGRLTRTSSELGQMIVSYDKLGHLDARTFVDAGGVPYHEKAIHRLDGSMSRLELRLSDNAYAPEVIDYAYDSANRLRSIMAGTTALYGASTIDILGRVRAAELGDNTHYTASYAELGRRLPISETVELTSGRKRTRLYQSFDAMGRELSRREDVNGAAGITSTRTYNALGQLATSRDSTPAKPGFPATSTTHTFTVDALGNQTSAVTTNGLINTSQVRATHGTVDRDRLCRLDYGPSTTGPCNVAHDGSGNIRSYPARGGATRTLTYYPSGGIRYIQQGSITANIRSDGSGEIEALDVTGAGAIDPRTDRRYGLTQQRVINGQTVLVRSIPGAGGIVATKRGATGPWIYGLSDGQGTRQTTDDGTEFVQEIKYSPFGVATSSGTQPNTVRYEQHQWNGGDTLPDFGLVLLGARVYDPALGRFLSRDPLIIPRSATRINPYAFAFNDPVNFRDPTGLDGEGVPTDPPVGCGGDRCPQPGDYVELVDDIVDWALSNIQTEHETSLLEDIGAFSASILDTVAPVTPDYWFARGDASVRAAFACDKLAGDFSTCVYSNIRNAEAFYQAGGMLTALFGRAGARMRQLPLSKAKGPLSSPKAKAPATAPTAAPATAPTTGGTSKANAGTWSVGDDVYAPTSRRSEPSWSTVRSRFWKNEAAAPGAGDRYGGTENVSRMQRGLAPQRYNVDKGGIEKMELSHEPIPQREGGKSFVPRWPQDHARVDPYRKPGY